MFTLIDVNDIGPVAAKVLMNPERHLNQSYDLTRSEKLNFGEMVKQLSEGLGIPIKYKSENLLHFL